MERRGWPWRKKTSAKMLKTSVEGLEGRPPRDYVEEKPHIGFNNASVLEAVALREEAEEKVKSLMEKLTSALGDLTAKEDLVKQHGKVAEDAVSGWEKAEAEALSLKQELEASVQQRKIVEDRVAHLDGALKECMRQVRLARDEQEPKIQEAILSKTREWEKIKAELNAKELELGRRLMESDAQNSAMTKSLQERARTIDEVKGAKAKAETEVKLLQVQLELLEKEIAALKYELHVINKELEIRNEEREYSRKSADAAHMQHLENVKKIAKLESECQRLRSLVRKKLPGPAALAQMRMEVEGLGRDVTGEGKRRNSFSCGRGSPSPPSAGSKQQNRDIAVKEIEMLTAQMLSMEEETKLLKEALIKRNGELQAARQLCARTAKKLSLAEDQLESLQGTPRESRNGIDLHTERSFAYRSENGNIRTDDEISCAESWASALITELAHFKKSRATSHVSRQSMESSNFDTIEEFLEIERDATSMPYPILPVHNSTVNESSNNITENQQLDVNNQSVNPEERRTLKIIASKAEELQAANLSCKDVSCKLSLVEEQLQALKSQSADNAETTAQVQESLRVLADAHQKVSKLDGVLDEMRTAVTSMEKNEGIEANSRAADEEKIVDFEANCRAADEEKNEGIEANSRAADEEKIVDIEANCRAADEEKNEDIEANPRAADGFSPSSESKCQPVASFRFIMCKLIMLLEILLRPSLPSAPLHAPNYDPSYDRSPKSGSPASPHVEQQMQDLVAAKEKCLLGKASLLEFLLRVGVALSGFCDMESSELEHLLSEEVAAPGTSADRDKTEADDGGREEALAELVSRTEAKAIELEKQLSATDEELQRTKLELADSKELVTNLRARMTESQDAEKKLAEEEEVRRSELQVRLMKAEEQMRELEGKVASLNVELADQRKQYDGTVAKCEDLEHQLVQRLADLQSPNVQDQTNFHDDEVARLKKERELAGAKEKLAECQRTIAVLGKQLTSLSSPLAHSPSASFDSVSMGSASMDRNSVPVTRTPTPSVDDRQPSWSCSANREGPMEHFQHHRRRPPHSCRNEPPYDYDPSPHWSPSQGCYVQEPGFCVPHHQRHRHIVSNLRSGGGNAVHSQLPPISDHPDSYPNQMAVTVYSPPNTTTSSPTTSPATYFQLGARRNSGDAVRASLTKSMHRAASVTSKSIKTPKTGSSSSFRRFFSLSKSHN